EVDRDGAGGEGIDAAAQRGPDAVPGLPDAGVGQPDDVEAGEPLRDVHLDVQDAGIDPHDGGGMNAGEHAASSRHEETPGGNVRTRLFYRRFETARFNDLNAYSI